MDISLFDFDLPRELIADRPIEPREAARLLNLTGPEIDHRRVGDLPDLLGAGDRLVFNNTRVLPAQLTARRGQAVIDLTLHQQQGPCRWLAFARPAKRLKIGDVLVFDNCVTARVADKLLDGPIELIFDLPADEFGDFLRQIGRRPIPPYIKRPHETGRALGGDNQDNHDYQTMFARHDGAVAAPTAGLHFTPAILATLAERGIEHTMLTLHVGAGTFLPVKTDDVRNHVMHAEWGHIDQTAADALNKTRRDGGRIIAIGTTTLRVMETAADDDGVIHPFAGDIRLFILPGYRFKAIDVLMTNFHLPKSTLFMLVSAFAGRETMLNAYQTAIAEQYRFFSYGDACLLARG